MSGSGSGLPKVYIVDDDDEVRDALGWLLRSRHLPSESFATAEAFEAMIDGQPRQEGGRPLWPIGPSCLVLDVRMPGTNGMVLFDRLLARDLVKKVPVIFLTGHGDVATAVDAVKRGAFDFAEKPLAGTALIERIDAALNASAAALAQSRMTRSKLELLESLTSREKEVTHFVLKGMTNREIGDQLGISVRTVETHRTRAFEKLGARSAIDLTNQLREMGADPAGLLWDERDAD